MAWLLIISTHVPGTTSQQQINSARRTEYTWDGVVETWDGSLVAVASVISAASRWCGIANTAYDTYYYLASSRRHLMEKAGIPAGVYGSLVDCYRIVYIFTSPTGPSHGYTHGIMLTH